MAQTDLSGSSNRVEVARRIFDTSRLLCSVALVVPTLTAIGRILDIPLLSQVLPTLPAVQANTAAGLALTSLGVFLTPERPAGFRRRVVVMLLASAILLLGLLTLGEYVFGWNVGIDRIFDGGAPTASQPFPGRPSPQTALNFVLLGSALFAFNEGVGLISVGQIAAIAAGANAVAAATGYIFTTHTLYGVPLNTSAIGMAVETAIAFLLLVIALLFRRPSDGMMTLVTSDTESGHMTRRILLAGIVAPPFVGALSRLGVAAGWYDVSAQSAAFVLLMAAIMLRTIWHTARHSEHEERQTRAALAAVEAVNAQLNRTVGERRIFAALVENSPDFIGIADASGKPVYLNPAGRRMVGLTPDFPIERTAIPDYYAPDQRAFASDVIVKGMVERGHWEGETAFRHWPTGNAIPVLDTHFMICNPDTGQTLGMGTITRDISEIRRAREAIEESNRRLQHANEQISRLNEKLTRLDEVKTRFFANVSHELRTPLALILGPVEKHLRETPDLDAGLRRDLEVIRRNARTVLRHVNDLLDVARLEAGRVKPEYSKADAAALVRLVTDHFSAVADDQHVEFVVDTPPSLRVQIDADKFQRIVLNLLSNAFKFTPRDGRVWVSLRESGPGIHMEVGDSGPGIPAAKRQAVFERFEQIEGDLTRRRPGTGLGLSIVKDFAVLLGGTVSAGEAPEGGALFVLDLPSQAPPGTEVRPAAGEQTAMPIIEQLVDELRESPVAAPAVRGDANGAGRVLVVEDNRDMSRFIGDTLRSDGFDVVSAFDGVEGYDKTTTERPDLVLTDVMMPKMSGDQLVHRLRQQAEFSSTPIVVLTAKTDEELRVRMLSDGAEDYLDKPFSPAELRARVRNLVARKRAEDLVSRMRRHLEVVAAASEEMSEAVAGLPGESVRTVFQTIALNAQHLTGAAYAAAAIGGDATHPFEVWAFVGVGGDELTKIGRPPCAVGLLGLVARENKAIRLRELREHPEYRGVPPHHPEIRSFLGVPIRYRGHAVGNLYLANKRDGAEFTEEDQQIVEMLAGRAGIAIETARLYAAEGHAHAWLQTVIDQMPEGIMLMDADGHVTMENRSLRALSNARTPVPDRYGNVFTIDLRQPSGEPLAADDLPIVKAMATQEITQAREFVGRRLDQSTVPLLVSAAPVITAEGRPGGAAMVVQDITALKQLEQLREEWASIVAHDLRQPISVISLRSALLLRTAVGAAQREDIRQIRSAAESLSRMANDLMDASLLDTRRLRVTLERLDLGHLIEDIVERASLAASRTRVRMPSDVRLFVKADAQRLEQIVANLLSNAVKYGSPETEIGLEVTHSGGTADIVVTNRGPGIPADDLPFVFERYARSRAAQAGKTKGLGLGLYIAKGLVEAHAGRIWAESAPDGVTAFHVALPLDGPAVPADTLVAAAPGAHDSGQQPEPS